MEELLCKLSDIKMGGRAGGRRRWGDQMDVRVEFDPIYDCYRNLLTKSVQLEDILKLLARRRRGSDITDELCDMMEHGRGGYGHMRRGGRHPRHDLDMDDIMDMLESHLGSGGYGRMRLGRNPRRDLDLDDIVDMLESRLGRGAWRL
jgi:hypothetical protein